MQKQVILIMEKDYPFGEFEDAVNKKSKMSIKTLVRKIHETRSLQERNQILEKISILRNMGMRQIIRIQTVLEEEDSIHLLYEYVPVKLVKWIRNIDDDFLKKVKEDVLNLGIELSQAGIYLNWDINNLGLDQNSLVKYYLDIDQLRIESHFDPKNLRKVHLANIHRMFEPFLINCVKVDESYDTQEHHRKLSQNKQRKNSSAPSHEDIEAFYQKQNLLLKKNQENLEKRKQSIAQKKKKKSGNHWKQLEQDDEILRDFINVLDDQKSQQEQKKPEQEEEEEEVIWNETQNENEQIVWIDSNEIQKRATQAIRRSREVMKVFRNIVQKRM